MFRIFFAVFRYFLAIFRLFPSRAIKRVPLSALLRRSLDGARRNGKTDWKSSACLGTNVVTVQHQEHDKRI